MIAMAAISGYHYAPLHPPSYLAHSSRHHAGPQAFHDMVEYQHPHSRQPLPPLSRLAQSRSKADFFRHLGWDERDEGHKRLYGLMKDEASAARMALTNNRENLVSDAAGDSLVQPPYSSSQMTETALFNEVRNIWQHACPETRPIYDRGAFTESGQSDNWIIRWVLWHVFRYRDVRNRNRNTPGRVDRASSASSAGSPTSPLEGPSAPRMVFDPVRDAHATNGTAFRRDGH